MPIRKDLLSQIVFDCKNFLQQYPLFELLKVSVISKNHRVHESLRWLLRLELNHSHAFGMQVLRKVWEMMRVRGFKFYSARKLWRELKDMGNKLWFFENEEIYLVEIGLGFCVWSGKEVTFNKSGTKSYDLFFHSYGVTKYFLCIRNMDILRILTCIWESFFTQRETH